MMKEIVNLTEWLPIWQKKGARHIPLHVVGEISFGALTKAMDGLETEEANNFFKNIARENESILSGKSPDMLRWDCCSSSSLKHEMAYTPDSVSRKARGRVDIDDPRLFDILSEISTGMDYKVRMVRRPWVLFEKFRDWPVEFRVFAREGKIVGVSNYYCQRDLKLYHEPQARACADVAAKFLEEVPTFSMDFGIDGSGQPVIIEAGPGHHETRGADPCCFPSETLLHPRNSPFPIVALTLHPQSPNAKRMEMFHERRKHLLSKR